MKKYLLPLSVAALLLSGCASEEQSAPAESDAPAATASAAPAAAAETAEPATGAMGSGSYTLDTGTGTVGTLEVPGTAPADIEEWRTAAGAEAVTYLTGNLDNREGSESFDVYTITVYDQDGNAYEYEPADDYLGSVPPSDTSAESYNPYIEMTNNYGTVVDAMERKDFVMVGPALPEQIAGISVSNGFEDFGAMPAE